MPSCFDNVCPVAPTEFSEAQKAFLKDTFAGKVNLLTGTYRTEEGTPWVFPIVKKIEKIMAEDLTLNYDYLPYVGLEAFSKAATKMLLGEESEIIANEQAFGIQSISATGSLHIGIDFLKTILNRNVVYLSDPSWDNHVCLFEKAGFEHIRRYRYWDMQNKSIDFEGMCKDLKNAPENAVVLLHACAHNPTATDPTKEQWMKLSQIIKDKKLFPFFDCSYQGFVRDLEDDVWSVRYFANEGHELFCAQSFSKNMGLYSGRVGNLTVIVNNKEKIAATKSQFEEIVKGTYLNPPCYGARIATTILTTPEYFQEWQVCLRIIRKRIKDLRQGLRDRLEARTQVETWKHITSQTGMFSYIGVPAEAVELLARKYHIFIRSGRLNVCALNAKNLDYVADSIAKTLEELRTTKAA